MIIFTKRTKKRIAREQREKFLLDRIKTLIEEVDRYKAESPEQESQLTIENQINGSDSLRKRKFPGKLEARRKTIRGTAPFKSRPRFRKPTRLS